MALQDTDFVSFGYIPRHGLAVLQRSPAFLAPGTGFVEDNFSMDRDRGGVGMVSG